MKAENRKKGRKCEGGMTFCWRDLQRRRRQNFFKQIIKTLVGGGGAGRVDANNEVLTKKWREYYCVSVCDNAAKRTERSVA